MTEASIQGPASSEAVEDQEHEGKAADEEPLEGENSNGQDSDGSAAQAVEEEQDEDDDFEKSAIPSIARCAAS